MTESTLRQQRFSEASWSVGLLSGVGWTSGVGWPKGQGSQALNFFPPLDWVGQIVATGGADPPSRRSTGGAPHKF